MVKYTSISFRPSKSLEDELAERSSSPYGERCQKDLKRYYKLLRRALRVIALTTKEGCLICDALKGISFEFSSSISSVLHLEIAEAISHRGLDKKWECDKKTLLTKIKNLEEIEAVAVIDAAEKFWQNKSEDIEKSVNQSFKIDSEDLL